MNPFVLMQDPDIPDPTRPAYAFSTIGLKCTHPGLGYMSCSDTGILARQHPGVPLTQVFRREFAFHDPEERHQFNGEIIFKYGLYFAVVTFTPMED